MRPSRTILLIIAAFAFGLACGTGQLPREAAAQDTSVGGVTWTYDGTSIVFTNTSETQAFALVGWQEDGQKAQVLPPRSHGKVAVAVSGLESVTLYKMEAALACNPRQCVLCTESAGGGGTHCPIPEWPPRDNEFRNITGPTSWGR